MTTILRRIAAGLRSLRRSDEELDEELGGFFDAAVDQKLAAGLSRDEARRAARLKVGGLMQAKESVREIGWESRAEMLWQDVRFAVRSLRRTPAFLITAAATLALGIGANTTIFSLMDAIMLRPLQVRDPGDLWIFYEERPIAPGDSQGGTGKSEIFPWPLVERFQAALPSGASLAAMTAPTNLNVRLGTDPTTTLVQTQLVSGAFFSTFGTRPALGRLLTDDDMQTMDAHPVAVLGHGFWQRQFGGDRSILNRPLSINGVAFAVVGVAEPGFRGVWVDSTIDIWVPLVMQHTLGYRQNAASNDADTDEPWVPQIRVSWLDVVVRARPELRSVVEHALAPLHQAAMREVVGDRTDAAARRLLESRLKTESFARGHSNIRFQYSSVLRMLMAMVTLLLLVASTNVANLFLARWATRQREVATRLSIGAARGRLVRQLLAEALVVAAVGGIAGLLLSNWASTALATSAQVRDLLPPNVSLDARVLAFCVATLVGTTLMVGIVPAWRATAAGPASGLRSGDARCGRTISTMRPLVGAQVALSLVLVVVAALLGRTLLNLWHLDPGYDHQHLVQIRLDPLAGGVKEEELSALYLRVAERARQVPGVLGAEISYLGIAGGTRSVGNIDVEGYVPVPGEVVRFMSNYVGPTYFSTTRMGLLRGRAFTEYDDAEAPRVAIVNESAARRYLGGVDKALGRRIGQPQMEIVGVVRDAHVMTLRETPTPMAFMPILQESQYARALDVRVRGDVAQIGEAVRSAVAADEPRLLASARPRIIREALDRGLSRDRLVAGLAAAFGILALMLAAVGLFGILTYAVEQRTAETGVRMALGASSLDAVRVVVGDGLRVAIVGIAVGLVAASVTGRVIRSLLFGVGPLDGVSLLAGPAILFAVSLIACLAPALRATRIDPAVTLRCD